MPPSTEDTHVVSESATRRLQEGSSVYKVVWIAHFKEEVGAEAAHRHWSEVHGPLAAKVPGIERYVQSHVISALGHVAPSNERTDFDGYSCCWYKDRAMFEDSLQTPEWAALGADSANMFDDSRWDGWSAALDPHVIIDGDEAPFKTVWIMRFTPEIRADPKLTREAHESWIDTHGREFGVRVPGISRYVQNHVVSAIDATGENPGLALEFDGFSECWFESGEAFERTMASEEWLAMNEDALRLFDVDAAVPRMSAVLDEQVIVDSELELSHV
jgi:uncharacterized protein (TIGR02118 family)